MNDPRSRLRTRTSEVWHHAKYASVGLELGISIAIGYWLGNQAQARWEIAPWGVIGGILLGFASGLRRLAQIAILESRRAASLPSHSPSSADSSSTHSPSNTHSPSTSHFDLKEPHE